MSHLVPLPRLHVVCKELGEDYHAVIADVHPSLAHLQYARR